MNARGIVVPIAGALVWLGFVLLRLLSVDDALWIARDDAVITLSHARNAADFGSIGVSPGGDRVEGFSSPLHFLAAYLIQLVASPGYRSMTIVILVAMSGATGAAAAAALRGLAERDRLALPRPGLVAIGLTAALAAIVVASWTSVGWIGSGMENPIVICAGALVVLVVCLSIGARTARALLVVVLVLFMISRVEFAAFALPLVCAAAWVLAIRSPANRRLRGFVLTVGAALLVVAMVHVARRLYFGEWLPNTAVVQARSTGVEQLLVIALIAAIPLGFLAIAVVKSGEVPVGKRGLVADLRIIVALLAAGLVLMVASGRAAGSARGLLALPPLVPLLLLIAVLLVVQRRVSPDPWIDNHVFAGLCVVPLGQHIAMGPARLDEHRVAVMAVPFLALWAAALGLHLVAVIRSAEHVLPWGNRRLRVGLAGVAVASIVVGMGAIIVKDRPHALQWEIPTAHEVVAVAHDVRDRHLADGLVILANPDLGKVSFDKSAVMVDLGQLGDPILARIARDRPDLVVTYLQVVARPDVVEAHGYWSCLYDQWLSSADFGANHVLSDEKWLTGYPQAEGCFLDGRFAIWVRTDAEREYALTRALMAATDPVPVAQAALDECASGEGGRFRCQGLRRSLQRASSRLRADGRWRIVVDVMRSSPSAALDVPLLLRGPGWAREAFDGYVELIGGSA